MTTTKLDENQTEARQEIIQTELQAEVSHAESRGDLKQVDIVNEVRNQNYFPAHALN
jgi:hypothetical protein